MLLIFCAKRIRETFIRGSESYAGCIRKRVAALDNGAAALALSSGTSAIFYSIINLCQSGDEIVSANNLYGGTFTQFNDILPQFGIKVKFVDSNDPQNFADAITSKTKLLFCETVSNPRPGHC